MTTKNTSADRADNVHLTVLVDSPEGSGIQTKESGPRLSRRTFIIYALLAIVLSIGGYFRFTGLDWDDSYHLHPDERFLTVVAGSLKSTDPISYLNTSESSLNPYNVPNTPLFVYGNFPMTVTRLVAELVDNFCSNFGDTCLHTFSTYDGIHLIGRFLSASIDMLSIVFVFLIGKRLYGPASGLLASLLLAAAALPIQQAHYFTMDNWAAAMTTMAIYFAVRASENNTRRIWWACFGLLLGLAVASRINVAPLAGVAVIAVVIWLARRAALDSQEGGWRYLLTDVGSRDFQRALFGLVLAATISLVVFRLAQPYAFADAQMIRETSLAETGQEPGFFKALLGPIIGFNPQWRANLAEIQSLQSPEASFPPALQWTSRTPLLFPLTNMAIWGMGLAAGIVALIGFFWALSRMIHISPDWTKHAIPVIWSGSYFLFMGVRWVKSIRYFLPIYPTLFLLAGWAMVQLWRRTERSTIKRIVVSMVGMAVIVLTLLWANSFVNIYRRPVTRVEASRWILENVPSGATLIYDVNGSEQNLQLPLKRFTFVSGGSPLYLNIKIPVDGVATGVRFNYLVDVDPEYGEGHIEQLHLRLMDSSTGESISETDQIITLDESRTTVLIDVPDILLKADNSYVLQVEAGPGSSFKAETSVIANEHWDDPLPVRYEGQDLFYLFYEGVSEGVIPITNPDSENKREGFLRWLEESDYIVLSSQRALWSLPRLPLTFPLTTRYYAALFREELGFSLVSEFHTNVQIGPLTISDTGGRFAWGSPARIGWPPPGPWAAEEAFSVYDHPPVWIFAKTTEYNPQKVSEILGSVDLSEVITMNPGEATAAPNGLMLNETDQELQRSSGTFSTSFYLDGVLASNPWITAVIWWLAVILLGLIGFPITYAVFRGLPDRGYAISRILSLLIISYLAWLVASVKLLPFTRSTLFLATAFLAFVSLIVAFIQRGRILPFIRRNLALIGIVELFGLILYLTFILVRVGNPDVWDVIWGGEKPMDLSYFIAVMKSAVFPPYDPWFAGGYINYYYYGFVYVGALTKMLGIDPAIAYNLILPMLASFTGTAAFSVAYNLVAASKPKEWLKFSAARISRTINGFRKDAIFAGFVAAILLLLMGNLAELPVAISTWYKAGDTTFRSGFAPIDALVKTADGGLDLVLTERTAPIYTGDWFWNATRTINYEPGEVQPITEFPYFTFLYGDLHAHMIALPLTLLALSWAISEALEGSDDKTWRIWLRFLIGGLAIGVLRATNTWDFPTYLLFGVIAVGYSVYRKKRRFELVIIGQAGARIVALIFTAVLLFLPYTESYGIAYSSFSLWPGSYTHVGNYLVIHGLFLFFMITNIACEFRAWTFTWRKDTLVTWEAYALPVVGGLLAFVGLIAFMLARGYWIAPMALTLSLAAGFLSIRPGISSARRIPLLLSSAAMALTLLVEIIVLDGDIGRMNTVFKFYLQVWVILSISSGVAIVWAWPSIRVRPRLRRYWMIGLILLVAAASLYPILATKAKWEIRMSDEAPATLDGMAFLKVTSYTDSAYDGSPRTIDLGYDYDALRWMQRNIDGSPVVAEAHSSNPYRSAAGRVAMYTGLPTIVGWDWHQRQQRAVLSANVVGKRITDVNRLFNTIDINEANTIIDKYDVSYVYLGQLEKAYYRPEGLDKFERMTELGLMTEVYRNDGTRIYRVSG